MSRRSAQAADAPTDPVAVADVSLATTAADAPPPDHPHPADPQGPEATGAVREPASAAAETAAAPVATTEAAPTVPSPTAMHKPAGPLSFVGMKEEGVEIEIVSTVLIDGIEIFTGRAIVAPSVADDLIRAGAAARAPGSKPGG